MNTNIFLKRISNLITAIAQRNIFQFLNWMFNQRIALVMNLILVLGVGNVYGQFTGTYNFSSGTDVTSFPYNGSAISNLSVSALTKNGVTSSPSVGNFRASYWTTGSTNGGVAGGAIDLTDYFEFTITAASGFTISNPTLNFGVGRSGTGPRRFQWRWSVDNYGNALTVGTVNGSISNASGVLTTPDANSGYAGNQINTTTFGQTTITFRFYAYGAEALDGTGGLQGNLTFGGTLVPISSLPVTWNKISINTLENGNQMFWSTSSEQNTSHFEVEYSEDAVQFYNASENISAAGNSSITQQYQFLHENEVRPWLYYRIKQVDLDGKIDYSKIVIAKRATKLPDFKVAIYPIPLIEGELKLDIHSIAQTEIQIRVIDLLGKEVHREKVPSKGYRTQHQLQLDHLPKGQYQIQIDNSIFSHQQRLVLLK
jgi:hypothetical protein